jgi:hypothetical protein
VTEEAFEGLREARKYPSPVGWLDPDQALGFANRCLQLHGADVIVRVVQRGDHFDLYLADGRVIHAGADLFNPRKFDKAAGPVLGKAVPYYPQKGWREVADAILRAREVEDLGGGEEEETREWLLGFTEDHGLMARVGASPADPDQPVDLDDPADLYSTLAQDDGAFYGSDDRLYLRVGQLLRWVNQEYRLRLTDAALRRRLSALGFSRPPTAEGKLSARDPATDQVSGRRFLASPRGFRP